MEILNSINSLPVIVQGALGSGLFWLTLKIGHGCLSFVSEKISKLQKRKQTALYIALGAALDDSQETREFLFQGMVHGALHYFVVAVVFIILALLFQNFLPVFSTVGYLGALFFAFRSLCFVPNFDKIKNAQEKYDALLKEQDEENNKADS